MKKNKVFLWSIVIALGGFLFGFDTAVISGAEQSIQKYWSLNTFEHGLTISIALIGTVIGSLLGAIPCDRLGRKNTLYIIAALYLISSLGSAFSTNWYLFLFFRFAGGLGVGASSVTAPIYISEIAPAERRGRLVALFQFNVVFGILISYLSNYLLGQLGENSWRLMLGIQAAPSLLFLLLLFIYIAFFAFSQGAVIWVFISEIFLTQISAKGQTLGSTTHWFMGDLIAFSFPYLAEKIGGGSTFLFFTVMMVAQLLFVWKLMPETKGRSL